VHSNTEGDAKMHQSGSNMLDRHKNRLNLAGFKCWQGKCTDGVDVQKIKTLLL
jgi:hypothetical protein